MQVKQYYSDDYAGLESGNLKFYYGYEVVDENDNWCFQVRESGEVIFKISRPEIEKSLKYSQLYTCNDYLIAGIGMWLLLK